MTVMHQLATAFLLCSIATSLPANAALTSERIFSPWNRELFQEKEGGFFVEFSFDGFLSPSMQNLAPDSVTVRVKNILTSENFAWTQDARSNAVWKAPAGKYDLVSIAIKDGQGRPRRWAPKGTSRAKPFLVIRQSLSNLGTWTLSPEGGQALRLKYTDTKPGISLTLPQEKKAVQSIIHGFKGLIQQRVSGEKTETASNVRARGGNLEFSVRSDRTLSIQRRVAVRGAAAKDISGVLGSSDPHLRECYKKRLTQDPNARGKMEMAFLISHESRTIKKLSLTGGDFQEQDFVQCIFDELTTLRFEVTSSVIGKITYEFEAKY